MEIVLARPGQLRGIARVTADNWRIDQVPIGSRLR